MSRSLVILARVVISEVLFNFVLDEGFSVEMIDQWAQLHYAVFIYLTFLAYIDSVSRQLLDDNCGFPAEVLKYSCRRLIVQTESPSGRQCVVAFFCAEKACNKAESVVSRDEITAGGQTH